MRLTTRYHERRIGDKINEAQNAPSQVEMGNITLTGADRDNIGGKRGKDSDVVRPWRSG